VQWLRPIARRPNAVARLICLPHAGGAASAFRSWTAEGSDVEVLAVTLPAREARIGEPATVDVPALTEAIAQSADRPFALFGHSMGGVLGFEVTRRLRRLGAALPRRLWVVAAPPPGERGPLSGAADLPDRELVERLATVGGMPSELLAEPAITALFLPAIRGDLRWLDGYPVPADEPLPVPIQAIAAAEDPHASPAMMRGWRRHTSATFQLEVTQGGHFFVHDEPATLSSRVVSALLADIAPGPGQLDSGFVSR
jgi:surfactin synthase thioesterase subunit